MNQVEFGYRVRQALNEGAAKVDYKTVLKLEKARQAALAQHKGAQPATVWVPALQLATATGPIDSPYSQGAWNWLRKMGLLAPLLALVVGLFGIYEWQRIQHLRELADIDFAVLLDETPIEAYADQGFSQFLQTQSLEE